MLPRLQEAAAERFDQMIGEDVSKMSAKGLEVEREPPGTRTLNLLIKSLASDVPKGVVRYKLELLCQWAKSHFEARMFSGVNPSHCVG